jgi:hypothetical protein
MQSFGHARRIGQSVSTRQNARASAEFVGIKPTKKPLTKDPGLTLDKLLKQPWSRRVVVHSQRSVDYLIANQGLMVRRKEAGLDSPVYLRQQLWLYLSAGHAGTSTLTMTEPSGYFTPSSPNWPLQITATVTQQMTMKAGRDSEDPGGSI